MLNLLKIYRSLSLLFLFGLNSITSYAQPNWLWAHGGGGQDDEANMAIATDASGNVYTTGFFYSDSITFGSYTLTNSGQSNMYIVKYDSNGNVIWAVKAGGSADDGTYSLAVDNAGNSYITGWFSSPSVTFGPSTLTNAGSGTYDIFIAKYDNNGNALWAKSAGGAFDDVAMTVTTDNAGNAYIGGWFGSASVTFGTTIINNFSTAWTNLFIVKYDTNGNVVWAKGAGGNNAEYVSSIAVCISGNVYATGSFSSATFTFDAVTFNGSGSAYDMFLIKLDSNGNAIWGKSASAMYGDYSYSVAVDGSDNSYVTGFYEALYLTFGTVTLTNAGGNSATRDIFLVKYDSSGTVQWAKGAGGLSHEESYSVAIDGNGNSYITGNYRSATMIVGSSTLTNVLPGKDELFLIKYDSAGNPVWANSIEGTDDDGGNSIIISTTGQGYIVGWFSSPSLAFTPYTVTNLNNGYVDTFIAKFDGTTGIIESHLLNQINLYPNPTTGDLFIEVSFNTEKEAVILIEDLLGRPIDKIDRGMILHQIYGFNLNRYNLKEGIYNVKLVTKDNIQCKRLVFLK